MQGQACMHGPDLRGTVAQAPPDISYPKCNDFKDRREDDGRGLAPATFLRQLLTPSCPVRHNQASNVHL